MHALRSPHLVLALHLAIAAGCGGDPAREPPVSSTDPRRNVLVMDDGIDPSVPQLDGVVVATYHIACEASAPSSSSDSGDAMPKPMMPTFDEQKASALSGLGKRSTRCRLKEGIDPKPDPFPTIAGFRDRWNNAFRSSIPLNKAFNSQELSRISGALSDAGSFHFHGTATSGTVAYENPDVRLVLVEMPLGMASTLMSRTKCLTQAEVDQTAAVLSDPEVQQAALDAPSSALDDDIAAVVAKHKIGLRNQSYGPVARATLEKVMRDKGCGTIDLRAFFTAVAEMDRRAAAAHPEAPLPVLAAGNDGAKIDGPVDEETCYESPVPRLVVGAYGVSGARAKFSNYGACVDVFAPGIAVVAPLPGGWLLPVDGTSFSAPLTVRLISRDLKGAFSPAAARESVLALRDDAGFVPVEKFPREVLYDPNSVLGPVLASAGLQVADAPPPRVDALALQRLLDLLMIGRATGHF